MKVFLIVVCAMFAMASAITSAADHHHPHHRFKYRGPAPPRPPPPPSYVKKWHMPPPPQIQYSGSQRFHQRRPPPPSSPPQSAQFGHGSSLSKYSFPPSKYTHALSFGNSNGPKPVQYQQLQQHHHQMHSQISTTLPLSAQQLPLQHKIVPSPPQNQPQLPPITKSQRPTHSSLVNTKNLWNYKGVTFEKEHKGAPFVSSPQINTLDYDYHVQTNAIPHAQALIKQVDDSGPIHTIPAPNLSPADKPKHMTRQELIDQYPKTHHKQQLIAYNSAPPPPPPPPKSSQVSSTPLKYTVEVQQSQGYQVTEGPTDHQHQHHQQNAGAQSVLLSDPYLEIDAASAFKNAADQLQFQHLDKLPQPQFLIQDQPQAQYLIQDQPQAQFLVQEQPQQQQHNQQQQTSGEILSIINGLSQHHPLMDIYPGPTSYQQTIQTSYPPQNVVGSAQTVPVSNGAGEHNHFQTFNFDDLQQQQQQLVQQPYEFQFLPQFYDAAQSHGQQQQDVGDQQNNQQQQQQVEYTKTKDDAIVNAFYSTLPNREAAEALASLQEAGKLNSHAGSNQQGSSAESSNSPGERQKAPMHIYVPDDFDEGEDRKKKSTSQAEEYLEQFAAVAEAATSGTEDHPSFGERIKPK